MTIQTVAIMSPGDMGHAVARRLGEHGLRVITCLRGRSERSVALAAQARMIDVLDDDTLVREADVFLSILVPAQAEPLAGRVAAALARTGASLLYVDCNAVAPGTVRRLAEIVTAAGARFVDAGIIGGPPVKGQPGPRFYTSGRHAAELAPLGEAGLDLRIIGAEPGKASGLKMCYAALTKGLTALAIELLVAGQVLGLSDVLNAELRSSQSGLFAWITRQAPGMPPKASRWVGEMKEIAATFEALGLTPRMLEGAANLYDFVAASPLGSETPEHRHAGRTLDEVVTTLAGFLTANSAAPE